VNFGMLLHDCYGQPHAPSIEDVEAKSRMLQAKALSCIEIARRMLPGSTDAEIEGQATDLMHLPQEAIESTLKRQNELAVKLAREAPVTPEARTPEEERIMARRIHWRNDAEQI